MSFERAEAFTRGQEGGWKPPDAGDPNPTLCGVTDKTYAAYRMRYSLAPQSVRLATPQELSTIYREFWDASGCTDIDALSEDLSLLHYDCVINSGPHEAARILQETVNVPKDGVIGMVTLAAVQQCTVEQPRATLMAYLQNRWDFLQELHNFPQWGRGWGRRLNACAVAVGVDWQVS